MSKVAGWTRRQFLSVSGAAAAAHSAAALPSRGIIGAAGLGLGQETVIPPPIVISGGIKPLFESNTTRPLRYIPEDGDFVVPNGGEFFNRDRKSTRLNSSH